MLSEGLGILCSIQLSYGGLCNISYLQLYFFPPVSICAKPCLSILDEPFKIAHAVLFLRLQEMRIDSHGNRHVRVSKIPRHFRYRPSEQDEHHLSLHPRGQTGQEGSGFSLIGLGSPGFSSVRTLHQPGKVDKHYLSD